MSFVLQPPETDLLVSLPAEGEKWDHHTVHTHYFGLSVAEAELGGFVYIRYQPALASCIGGVAFFRGMDNVHPLDMEFLDYQITMPYPTVDGNSITSANGLCLDFTEPGREVRLTYRSPDGTTEMDVVQTAVTPLFSRGHVVPGEDDHADPLRRPGGSEQFMHCVGELAVRGERFAVDCYAPRDRSWRQVRTEDPGGARRIPPIAWSPMYFGPDLACNTVSFEDADADPAWAGLYDLPEGAPMHHYAWMYVNGEGREATRVRRNVLEQHPRTHVATRQEIEVTDEAGDVHRFRGEAIAAAPMPAWPNSAFYDTVYRWEDDDGRACHVTYQEMWWDTYQRAMSDRARQRAGT